MFRHVGYSERLFVCWWWPNRRDVECEVAGAQFATLELITKCIAAHVPRVNAGGWGLGLLSCLASFLLVFENVLSDFGTCPTGNMGRSDRSSRPPGRAGILSVRDALGRAGLWGRRLRAFSPVSQMASIIELNNNLDVLSRVDGITETRSRRVSQMVPCTGAHTKACARACARRARLPSLDSTAAGFQAESGAWREGGKITASCWTPASPRYGQSQLNPTIMRAGLRGPWLNAIVSSWRKKTGNFRRHDEVVEKLMSGCCNWDVVICPA